ncbi:hypothetical protein GCM10022221_68010 [Actinocorallia aurea]
MNRTAAQTRHAAAVAGTGQISLPVEGAGLPVLWSTDWRTARTRYDLTGGRADGAVLLSLDRAMPADATRPASAYVTFGVPEFRGRRRGFRHQPHFHGCTAHGSALVDLAQPDTLAARLATIAHWPNRPDAAALAIATVRALLAHWRSRSDMADLITAHRAATAAAENAPRR